ncbi:hypothetical protein CBL_12478 [Carabus blaptoides fortunei]
MAETISVNFTGPALAFLMYENANAGQEQEGFLLGDTHVVLKSTVTDADSHNVHTRKFVNVKAIVACPSTCLFYNCAGQIDKEKLKAIIGSQMNVVVGWFKYDPSSNLRLTLRGTILHKELSKIFSIAPELFTCCLLTAMCSQNNSTHTYTHKLLRYENGHFETVPMHIENLGDPCNTYKPKSPSSRTFLKMCQSLGASRDAELHIVSDIQDNLQNKIVTAMVDLVKSERKKTQLKREVEHLRQLVETRRAQLAEQALAKENKMKDAVAHENICFLVDEENNEMADASDQMNNTNSNKQICLDAGTSSDVKGGQKMSKKVQKNKRKADAMKSKNKTEGESDVSSANTSTESLPAVNNPMDETTQLVDLTLSDGDEHIPSSATNTCTNTSVAAAVAEQPMKSTYAQAIATKTKPKRNK